MYFQFSCRSSDDEDYLKDIEKAKLESVLGEDLDKYTNGIICRSCNMFSNWGLRTQVPDTFMSFVWVFSTSLQAQLSAASAGRQ